MPDIDEKITDLISHIDVKLKSIDKLSSGKKSNSTEKKIYDDMSKFLYKLQIDIADLTIDEGKNDIEEEEEENDDDSEEKIDENSKYDSFVSELSEEEIEYEDE